jgi:glycosyltransferase involved in cell wall biosynthesis
MLTYPPDVTVLITTKDRKEELRQALASALTQNAVNEILVFDDGSTDGTSELVRNEFRSVRLERSERPLGIIAARNRAIEMATGSVVITIDDDCIFQSPDTVAATLKDFHGPEVGAVAIPHINVNQSTIVHSQAPRSDRVYAISEFSGGASAIRRDLFLALGGYNTALWRQCEEYDFCTRLLGHGYVTRCGSADPILHYESPARNKAEILFHGARGNILYAWCNVPLWALIPHAVISAALSLFHAFRMRDLKSATMGLASAVSAIVSRRAIRTPVTSRVYRTIRRLRRSGPIELVALVPSLCVASASDQFRNEKSNMSESSL